MTAPHRQCAAVLVQNAEGQLLAVQHAYGQRFWGFPGGVVEIGETPMQAAMRETLEEVGADVNLTGLVGLYLLQGGGWPDILAFVFRGTLTGVPRIVNPDEIAQLAWVDAVDFPAPLLPDVEAALQDFGAGRTGVVRQVQQNVRMAALPPDPL